ncbi:MAG: Anhydrotetracycline monooxygenase [Paracidovorax wautersii]|uniref:Anhydrotetracycline monooxygenase n=1 Tax=Paracidovorax wautersii TaxID=1177982 RepID=A0A7V8JRM3_9BURK|nr:MAG: Anhydrotetracycline monooxygenase [Paracidovorax wautersii]
MHLQDLPTVAADAAVDFQSLEFDYQRAADHGREPPAQHPVVVVGAGPVGLALAIDLAQRQIPVVLLDNDHRLSTGSRAICFAKRTLEVFDRLGCAVPMLAKGVAWQTGRVFFGEQEVYTFDLLPEPGHQHPAFINLQQYHVEGQLAARAAQLPQLDLRWRSAVTGLAQDAQAAVLTIDTPDGPYRLAASHVVACDGARSTLRALLGQESHGRTFQDRFLIADVRIQPTRATPDGAPADGPRGHGLPSAGAQGPAERWFWFDPPFHPGQSVLLHQQADDIWRVDFQLGWDADPEAKKRPEAIRPRIQALLGPDATFELVWASVYAFSCKRMDHFRHGRVLFAGDAAHGVSPFGARGANSGVQDADNLGWKLAAVVRGEAPPALLDSYASERESAADENILNSTRSTDFITPKSAASRLLRNAVLDLARQHPFARRLVNSGRLSTPSTLQGSPLNTADTRHGEPYAADAPGPGAPAPDAPLATGWLLRTAAGAPGFAALVFGDGPQAQASLQALAQADRPIQAITIAGGGAHTLAWQRYDARPGSVYLLRPDQHVCARWRQPDADAVAAAYDRAMARH